MTLAQQVLDFDLDFMRKAFSLVDSQCEMVDKCMAEDFAADGDSALAEDSEYLHGIGFVTAQKYLTAACKVLGMANDKSKAFAVGPMVNVDVSCAELVNAIGNHWKHIDEWDFDNLTVQQKTTREMLEQAGLQVRANGGDYVASNAMSKLALKRFADLLPKLKEWSETVEAAFPR